MLYQWQSRAHITGHYLKQHRMKAIQSFFHHSREANRSLRISTAVKNAGEVRHENQQRIDALQKQGLVVTIVGVAPHPDKTSTNIKAGRYKKQDTDETEVGTIRVNDRTLVLRQKSEQVPPATVQRLQEGEEIVVEGDKSNRGVIRARGVRYVQ